MGLSSATLWVSLSLAHRQETLIFAPASCILLEAFNLAVLPVHA